MPKMSKNLKDNVIYSFLSIKDDHWPYHISTDGIIIPSKVIMNVLFK